MQSQAIPLGETDLARKPTDEVQLKLRFDERLRRRLEKAAEQHVFSMNREIIERLEQSFSAEDQAAQFDEMKRLLVEQKRAVQFDEMKRLLVEQKRLLADRDHEIAAIHKTLIDVLDEMRSSPMSKRLLEAQAAGIDVMQVLKEALNKTRSK
jgi:hypothetical protein